MRAVFLPRHRRGVAFLLPLLIVPFIVYNVLAFLLYGGGIAMWSGTVLTVSMISGAQWTVSAGEMLLALGLVCLFVEMLKSTRTGSSSILEHMLSTLVFVLFLVEFLLVRAAGSSTFFLLMLMSLIDLVAGFSVSISSAERDVSYD
jgi:hypothetical protein